MRTRILTAALAAGVLLLWSAVIEALPSKGSTVTVQVMSVKVMKAPGFLGATVATVVRGEHLTFEDAQKDWYKVTTGKGKTGWVNRSSVVDKKVALSTRPGGGTGGASQDEIALAGRGFSPEVESAYRGKHPELDFSHVDNVEKLDVDTEALAKFAADGKVGGGK